MLVDNSVYKNTYVGNGAAVAFPISFPFLDNTHVKVVRSTDGINDEVVPATEYTVTGAGNEAGGTCTFKVAPSQGVKIAITRNVPITQLYEYEELDNFPAKSHENALAKLTMICQMLAEEINRAITVEPTSPITPEELLQNIFGIKSDAAESASDAAASADIACEYKQEAQAATDKAKQWAEKDLNLPVEYDSDGNPKYSAKHWANKYKWGLALSTPFPKDDAEAQAALAAQMPPGGFITAPVDDYDANIGNIVITNIYNQAYNSEEWITESGEWTAPVTGWYNGLLIGGGDGGNGNLINNNNSRFAKGGDSGNYKSFLIYLTEGKSVPVIIGSGGIGVSGNDLPSRRGGITSFYNISTAVFNDNEWHGFMGIQLYTINVAGIVATPGGFGARYLNIGFYGAGGMAVVENSVSVANGAPGAIRLRYYDPAKANGPAASTLTLSRKAARAAKPVTVNLYDPETGQGSVWLEEDAPAQLARGLITQEAWQAICEQQAAEAHAAWLADPDTEAERIEMLRAACEQKLSQTDKFTVPDYPITEEQRQAILAYRQAIRDLSHQEGAPWDGGGELTPWPVMPTLNTEEGE